MNNEARHKTLSLEEVLEYVAFAVYTRDLPEEWDGEITCDMNDDGSVNVYAVEKDTSLEPTLN